MLSIHLRSSQSASEASTSAWPAELQFIEPPAALSSPSLTISRFRQATRDMQREVWNSSPSSVLKVSVMAGMLEGVAVLKCSSQTQVKTAQDMQREVWNSSHAANVAMVLMQGESQRGNGQCEQHVGREGAGASKGARVIKQHLKQRG